MPEIRPFTGVFINPSKVNPQDILTEPYDKISEAHREIYLKRSPYNLVRIILGKEESGDNETHNKYNRAAQLYREWFSQKILIPGEQPALFYHEQDFVAPGHSMPLKRRGLIARVRAVPFSEGTILPHEHTLSKPKADRLALLRATQVHFEQIFLLYPGSNPVPQPTHEPVLSYTDELKTIHRFWMITDPKIIESVAATLSPRVFYIADGHHRYETALAYSQEQRQQITHHGKPDAAEFLTASLVSMEDPGLVILPTHRVVNRLSSFNPSELLTKLSVNFTVMNHPSLKALESVMHQSHTFGLILSDNLYSLQLKQSDDLTKAFASHPPLWESLDVAILQVLILEKILKIDAEKIREENNVTYYRESSAALEQVQSGQAQVAFLLRPTPIEQVKAVSDARSRMPQKSTDFYPKLATGLVAYDLNLN